MRRLLFLAVPLFLIASSVVGQRTSLSREDFEASYFAADGLTKSFPRIHESESKGSIGGRLKVRKWRWIYGAPYTSSLRFEEIGSDGNRTFEMINIRESTYCGDGTSWRKVDGGACQFPAPWAVTQLSWMMKLGAKSEFTEEKMVRAGEAIIKYTEFANLEKRRLPSGAEAPAGSYESTFIIDSKGRFVRIEYKGFVSGSKEMTSSWIDTFKYDGKFTVEPPIQK